MDIKLLLIHLLIIKSYTLDDDPFFGTISAAKVLVVGAGVAGLQAIAAAKRMGAIVFATDVRSASKNKLKV